MKFDWKAALPVVDFHPRMLFSTEKFFFYGWPTLAWSHLFWKLAGSNYKNYWSHAGQVQRKVNCGELSVKITLLGLPHIMKATPWNMTKSTRQANLFNKSPAERWTSCQTWILRSPKVITRINLETCIII